MESTTNTSNLFDLQLDPRSQSFLYETSKWAKFVAIVSFVFVGLMLILLLVVAALASNTPFPDNDFQVYGGGMLVVVAIFMTVVVVIPNIYLLKFANKMQVALRNNDQPTLISSLSNVKSYFKFIGILYIVVIALWLLMFIRNGISGL